MSANGTKSAKGHKRAFPHKNCEQSGLKQPGLGTPNIYRNLGLVPGNRDPNTLRQVHSAVGCVGSLPVLELMCSVVSLRTVN